MLGKLLFIFGKKVANAIAMLSWFTFLLAELGCPFLVLVLLCCLYVKKSAVNTLISDKVSIKSRKNILFVIAHPDDECMFFAPTIISLTNAGHNVYLVCLSKGNFYGQGEKRKKELVTSCTVLGIPVRNLSIVDDERFQDGMDNMWEPAALGDTILSVVQRVGAEAVITFDQFGVSNHPNHVALHTALTQLQSSGKMKDVCLYVLESTNIVRKYISFFDIPYSSIVNMTTFICSPKEVWYAWKAMKCHKTQMVWFRKLYIIFSRYMYVNTLQEVR